MPVIKEFIATIEQMRITHEKKNNDYSASDPFENFERAAELISWFKREKDKTFVNHIATKLARLATLLNKEGEPNNESIEDSFLDLAVYIVLWKSYYESKKFKQQVQPHVWNDHNHCHICGIPKFPNL